MRNQIMKSLAILGFGLSIVSCSSGSSSSGSGTPSGNATLAISSPSQYPAGQSSTVTAVVTITNTSTVNASNIVYSVPTDSNHTGATVTINPTGVAGNDCTSIMANTSCSVTATIGANANPGSFSVVAIQDSSSSASTKLNSASVQPLAESNVTTATKNLGLVNIPVNTHQFYILPGTQTINANESGSTNAMVSLLVENNAQTFDSIVLVDETGTALNYQLVGALSTNVGGVNTYQVTIPAGKSVQAIQAFSTLNGTSVCDTLTPSVGACSNSALVNLVGSTDGVLEILPDNFNMTPSYTTQVVTLTNTGNGAVTNIQAPTPAEPFSVSDNNCTTSLASGKSCTLTIDYTPGTNSGVASILVSYNNGSATATTAVAIPYVGTTPTPTAIVTASPTTVALSESNTQQLIVLTNSGTADATDFTVPESVPAALAVEHNTCTTTLSAGANCSYTIGYESTTLIPGSTVLTFTYNNGQAEQGLNVPVTWKVYNPIAPIPYLLSGWSNGTVWVGDTLLPGSGVGGLDSQGIQAVIQTGTSIYAATSVNVWQNSLNPLTTWSQVGGGSVGLNGQIQAMAVFESTVYVAFADNSSIPATYQILSSVNNDQWSYIANDIPITTGTINTLTVDKAGNLYAGTTTGLNTGQVWEYNGTTWRQLGADLNFPVKVIGFNNNGDLFASGTRVLSVGNGVSVAVFDPGAGVWFPVAINVAADGFPEATLQDMTVVPSRTLPSPATDVYLALNTNQNGLSVVFQVSWLGGSTWSASSLIGGGTITDDIGSINYAANELYVCGAAVYRLNTDVPASTWQQINGSGVNGSLFSDANEPSVAATCQNSGTLSATVVGGVFAGLSGSQLFHLQSAPNAAKPALRGAPPAVAEQVLWTQLGTEAVASNASVAAVGGVGTHAYAAITNNYYGQTTTSVVYQASALAWSALPAGSWGSTDTINAMVVDSNDKLSVATSDKFGNFSGIYAYESGSWINTMFSFPGSESNHVVQLIINNENVLIAGTSNGYVYTSVAPITGNWTQMGGSSLNALLSSGLYTIAVDNSNNLFASGSGGVVYELAVAGSTWLPIARPETDFTYFANIVNPPYISNLTLDGTGNMYAAIVSTSITNHACGVYELPHSSTDWGMLGVVDRPSFDNCTGAPGLAVDNSGNVYAGIIQSGSIGSGIAQVNTNSVITGWNFVIPQDYALLNGSTSGYNPPMAVLYLTPDPVNSSSTEAGLSAMLRKK